MCFELGFVEDPVHKLIGVTPNIVTTCGVCGEIKSPRYRKIEEDMDEENMKIILPYYWHQCQMQAKALLLTKIDFIQYRTALNRHYAQKDTLTVHPLLPDDMWFANFGDQVRLFWDEMMQYRLEHPDWSKKVWPTEPLKITPSVTVIQDEMTKRTRKCPFAPKSRDSKLRKLGHCYKPGLL